MAKFPYNVGSKYGKGPLVFVCTTSPAWSGSPLFTSGAIRKFTHNLRNGHGCTGFCWVREVSKRGAPHYHFCADMPDIVDPVGLSFYWSSLFGQRSPNCIRLGSEPDKEGKRIFRVGARNAKRYGWYLGKYFTKGFDKTDDFGGQKFRISAKVGLASQPIKYQVQYHFTQPGPDVLSASGKMVAAPVSCIGQTWSNEAGEYFDKHKYKWTKAKTEFPVYFGRLNTRPLKSK